MTVTPDTKDWTWVLERACPECGFDASVIDHRDVAALIRSNSALWPELLTRADVRIRPDESTWSALEYAAHVRDVYRIAAIRLDLMLAEDNPRFANWDQDDTAVSENYNAQDPGVVAVELAESAERFAEALDAVPDDVWSRRGTRSDGAIFTVATFARYVIHDPVHHLWDVARPWEESA